MDKTKIGAVVALIVIGAGLILAKSQDPAAPAADEEDHPDEAPAAQNVKSNVDLAGGVKTLKIEDEKVGSGPAAKAGDILIMEYKGSLLDGSVFDQSYGRSPFEFPLGGGRVIKGWDQGIVGMKVGGKRKLTIPSDLGYGDDGSPPKIPSGATLMFEVELLKIKAP